MSKRKKQKTEPKYNLGPTVEAKVLEVSIKEVNGDTTKLIKKFCKKVRKEEILKPFYRRLMYFETKSQKRRQKKMYGIYEWRKKVSKQEDE